MEVATSNDDQMEKGMVEEIFTGTVNLGGRPEQQYRSSFVKAISQIFNKPYTLGTTNQEPNIIRTLAACPEGYPRLAAFLDSDENFMIYRRFGFLQARLLLYKQDQLRQLEEKLDGLDEDDAEFHPRFLLSRQTDDARSGVRGKLMLEIEEKFKEYTSVVAIARELLECSKASETDIQSVRNFLNMNKGLDSKEIYLRREEDMITLKPGRENTWLDSLIWRILLAFTSKVIRYIFVSRQLAAKTDFQSSGIILYKRERIAMVVSFIIMGIILALLVLPSWLLWHLTSQTHISMPATFVILGLFTLAFSVVLSVFTKAKRHEILGAAAAYCAVLVVFLSNVNQLSSSATAA